MNLRNVSDAAVDPTSDDEDGVIKELDANVHQAAITILGEATCNRYKPHWKENINDIKTKNLFVLYADKG